MNLPSPLLSTSLHHKCASNQLTLRSGSVVQIKIHSRKIRSNIKPSQVTRSAFSVEERQTAPPKNVDSKITKQDWDSFVSSYNSQYVEHAFFVDPASIEGEIPKELSGTFIRNGPGLFEIGDQKVNQPFDGDGLIAAFAFPGNGQPPFFANRFVRTEAFVKEQEAGKMIYRGAFSVGNPSGSGFYNPFDLSIKKVANTAVVHWAKRILALYERDLPYHLSSPDLKTVGPTDLDGAIDAPYFAAHHRIITDPIDGSRRLIGFCSEEEGLSNKVTIWEFNEEGKQLHKTQVVMPDAAFAFLHDMVMTENHYIFLENPVKMNINKLLTKYMFGKACIAECLQYDPESRSTKIHVIARPGRTSTPATSTQHHRVFKSPTPFFSFHHANAYESPQGDGRIVIDTVALLNGMDFSTNLDCGASYYDDNVGRGSLTRLVITPWESDADKMVTQEVLMDRACEFPSVAPSVVGKPHQHVYMVGARMDEVENWGPPEVVVKTSLIRDATTSSSSPSGNNDTKQLVFHPGKDCWCGEPLFIPRPNGKEEDDGWVVVVVYNATTSASELVLLDAKDLTKVATVKLGGIMLPAGLHGTWSNEYLGPAFGSEDEMKFKKDGGIKYDIRQGGPLKYE